MKTERRHDLETNELARRATVWIEKVKPFSAQIVGVLLLLLGVWVVSSVWGSMSSLQDEAAWDAYALALTANDMELTNMQRLAGDEQYEGTLMQEWAYAAWADRQLYLASKEYFINRAAAQERLNRILSVYDQLATNGSEDQLRNRARFGMARVYELQDKLEDAGKAYDQVEGDLESLARVYADRLLKPETKETYAWLSTTQLPRRSREGAGIPGSRPAFDAELPNSTDPTGLNVRTLEDILKLEGEKPDQGRYDQQAPKEKSDKTESASNAGDDIFGDEQPAESTAGEKPLDEAPADAPEQP